jgi:hypothetical protein
LNTTELRKRLEEARTNRERLFGELQNLKARAEVDGESDGLAERVSNLNRGIENADSKIAEMESAYGRRSEFRDAALRTVGMVELEDGVRGGRFALEDGDHRVERGSVPSRSSWSGRPSSMLPW